MYIVLFRQELNLNVTTQKVTEQRN